MTTSPAPRTLPVWILRILSIIGITCCVPALLFGVILVASDLGDGDSGGYDGLGLVLGGFLAVAALVVIVVLAVVLLLLVRHPRAGLMTAAVLGGLALVGLTLLFLLGPGLHSDDWLGFLVYAGAAAAIVALGVWGLVPPVGRTDAGADLPRP